MLIYDMDRRKHESKSMKLEGLVFLEKHAQDQNKWVANVWCDWVRYRLQLGHPTVLLTLTITIEVGKGQFLWHI